MYCKVSFKKTQIQLNGRLEALIVSQWAVGCTNKRSWVCLWHCSLQKVQKEQNWRMATIGCHLPMNALKVERKRQCQLGRINGSSGNNNSSSLTAFSPSSCPENWKDSRNWCSQLAIETCLEFDHKTHTQAVLKWKCLCVRPLSQLWLTIRLSD